MPVEFSETQRRTTLFGLGADASAANEILERFSKDRWWPDLLATDKNLGQLILALSTLPTEAIAAPNGMETILNRLSDLVEGRVSSSRVTSL
jgi:hypothetical protein